MTTSTPRRAGALLLAVALLLAAVPAAAAPDRAAVEGPSLLESVTAWLSGLVPGAMPVPVRAALGPEAEPSGGPESTESTGDDPTAEPQRGPEADPSG